MENKERRIVAALRLHNNESLITRFCRESVQYQRRKRASLREHGRVYRRGRAPHHPHLSYFSALHQLHVACRSTWIRYKNRLGDARGRSTNPCRAESTGTRYLDCAKHQPTRSRKNQAVAFANHQTETSWLGAVSNE
jgi:hypothetical protein